MVNRKFILVLVLLVSCSIFLIRTSPSSGLPIHYSGGGTVVEGGNVLVAGDKIHTGQELRVITQPLYLKSDQNRLLYFPETTLKLLNKSPNQQLVLSYRQGTGKITVHSGEIIHRWKTSRLLQTAGTLHWSYSSGKLNLTVDENFKGKWKKKGKLIFEKKLNNLFPATLTPINLPPTRPAWHQKIGNLVRTSRFAKKLKKYCQQHSIPENLLDIAGHWPRDPWGNIFLFRSRKNKLALRSAGPDEQIYTDDDQVENITCH